MIPISMHEGRELPTFSLREIDLPQVREWEVNEQYYLVIKVEQTGKRNMSYLPDKSERTLVEGDFRMLSVQALGTKPVDLATVEQNDFERATAEAYDQHRE